MKAPVVPLLAACFGAIVVSAQAAPKAFHGPGVSFLWYVFQGLTKDGAHYVAAQIRVTHPSRPATAVVKDYADFEKQYPAYLARASRKLAAQPDDSFYPSLTALQALFASIEVKPSR